MAYNRKNYLKKARYIADIYQMVKEHDIPDTHIVRCIFPKYGIFISYGRWMVIKSMKQTALPPAQQTLFTNPELLTG